MLVNFQQFLVRYGARSQIHLTNLPLTPTQEIVLPRQSVLHHLTFSDDATFVDRGLHYLANIKQGRKIPVLNVADIITKDDVQLMIVKTLARDIQRWRRDNAKDFRLADLLTVGNTDAQVNSVINYNLLKGMYSYKGVVTAHSSKYNNIHRTYWDGVKKAVAVDKTSYQFVRITIPTMLPSVNIIDRILTFKPQVYARVVHNSDLNDIINLYRYIDPDLRSGSTISAISEEESASVIVELVYKGYSSFFRLSDLVSMSDKSKLPGKRKLPAKQLHRFLLIMFMKVQNKVMSLEAGDAIIEAASNTDGVDDHDDTVSEPEQTPDESEDGETTASTTGSDHPAISHASKLAPITKAKLDDDFADAEMVNLSEPSELETSSDDIFLSMIASSMNHVEELVTPNEESSLPDLGVNYDPEHVDGVLTTKSSSDNFNAYVTTAKTNGVISAVEARAMKKLHESRQTLKSPYSEQTIDVERVVTTEDVSISEEETALPINNNLVADHYKSDIIGAMDKKYITKVMNKDILACVTHLESADIIIKNYEVETNVSALGTYDIHKLTIKPYRGKESTVFFRIPKVNDEGEMSASGIKYRMRKVRTDNPIRKISPTKVALTSNYGKMFVFRTERKSFDRSVQVADFIKNQYLTGTGLVTTVSPGDSFDNTATLPNDYMYMSKNFKSFETKDYVFVFSDGEAKLQVKPELLAEISSKGYVFCGHTTAGNVPLVMDKASDILNYKTGEKLGTLPELVGMDTSKLPTQFSMMKVLGDNIPLGVVLGYYMGLNNLLAATGTKCIVTEPRKQVKLEVDDLVIRLEDCKLVVTADTPEKKLLFAGFAFYKDFIKTTDLQSLNDKSVYLDVIESRGAGTIHLKELDLLERLFLDPITVGVLRDMKEPTDYLKLLLRANELLKDFNHPDVNDPMYSRIRGYDRVPGLMYRVLAGSVRTHKIGNGRGKIELDPYKVWNTIVQDTTVKILEDNNPVTDIKEMESGTFSGLDGLDKTSTPIALRRYHKKDKGLISEATVDSSDVGLSFYLTPYAKMKDLRGTVTDTSTIDGKVFSTSVLLAPMAEQDDRTGPLTL